MDGGMTEPRIEAGRTLRSSKVCDGMVREAWDEGYEAGKTNAEELALMRSLAVQEAMQVWAIPALAVFAERNPGAREALKRCRAAMRGDTERATRELFLENVEKRLVMDAPLRMRPWIRTRVVAILDEVAAAPPSKKVAS